MVRVVLESGDERILDSHRREVTAVFCDPRSFINFAEAVEPEDVIGVLGEHLGALGPIIFKYEDALMRFTGDSLMVFFNDPPPATTRPGTPCRWRSRCGAKCSRSVGCSGGAGTTSTSARASPSAMPPAAVSASRGTSTTARSAPSPTSPPDSAVRREEARSRSPNGAYLTVVDHAEIASIGVLALRGCARPAPAFNIVALNAGVPARYAMSLPVSRCSYQWRPMRVASSLREVTAHTRP
jgi:class 3 adenylate cyclase